MPRLKKTALSDQAAPSTTETTETTMQETPLPATEAAAEAKAPKRIPAKTTRKGVPVSPQRVLEITREMDGQPSDMIAKAAGYYTEITTTATGKVEVVVRQQDNQAYLCALVAAQGFAIAPPVRAGRRAGRAPTLKIGANGTIVIGARHTAAAGFPFGENVEARVHVATENGKITVTLVPQEEVEAEEVDLDYDTAETDGDAFMESEIDD